MTPSPRAVRETRPMGRSIRKAPSRCLVRRPAGSTTLRRRKIEPRSTIYNNSSPKRRILALRAQAELENFRKRSRRQLEDERKYADLPMMRALLPVLDNIDRAIQAASVTKDADALLEGIELVAKQLQDVLGQRACQPIDALHAPFDPNQHEAILMRPDVDHPANTVVEVVQPGFQLHDRVVRPTQVIVSNGKPS